MNSLLMFSSSCYLGNGFHLLHLVTLRVISYWIAILDADVLHQSKLDVAVGEQVYELTLSSNEFFDDVDVFPFYAFRLRLRMGLMLGIVQPRPNHRVRMIYNPSGIHDEFLLRLLSATN